jgi:PAS domain S-box-containing protein
MKTLIHILHLEDDPTDTKRIQDCLVEGGLSCRISSVLTRTEFESILDNGKPDIILAAYRPDALDGMAALRLAQEKLAEVPFIFVSNTMGEEVIDALTQGATDYVLKQNLSRLVPAVQRALEKARARRQRREAYEALQQSNDRLRKIIDTAPLAIFDMDLDGNVDSVWNPAAEKMFGWRAPEVLGKPLPTVSADQLEETQQIRKRIHNGNIIQDLIVTRHKRDGMPINYRVFAAPLYDTKGRVSGDVTVLLDVTDSVHNRMINAARLHLLQFAANHSLEELLEETINETEKVTDSQIGFYHFVDDDQHSLTLQAWSTRTKAQFCKSNDKTLHYPIADAGVWVDCIRQGKPVIHNDYLSLPHRKGMPEGQVDIHREMVVPVMRGGRIKAVLGVGNKPTDYTEKDVEAISLMADLAWEITERKQVEERVSLMGFALNAIHEIVLLADEDGRFQYVNELASKYFGYSREALLNMGHQDIKPDHTPSGWRRHWEDLKKNRSLTFEKLVETKEGRHVPMEINAYYFEFQGTCYNLGLLRDISERKQAEQDRASNLRYFESMDKINRAIQRAEDQTKMLREVLDVVLAIFDCDRVFLLHPCDPDAPKWTIPMESCKPEYPGAEQLNIEVPMTPHTAENFRAVLAAKGPVTVGPGLSQQLPETIVEQFGVKSLMAMAIYPKTGSPWQFGIQQCASACVWTPEEIRQFENIGRRLEDALTNMLTQRDLRENEAFLDRIVEHIPNMIFVKDAKTLNFLRFNRAGEQLLGKKREELLGKNEYDFFPKAKAEIFLAKDRKVLDSKKRVDIPEETIGNKNGENLILHTQKIPILDENGTPQYLLGISEDITERKNLEAMLRQVQKMEAIGQLAGGIAHDFNNILSAITGFTELSLSTVESESQPFKYMARVLEACKRAKDLVNQILMFSRETVQELKPIQISLPVKEALRLVRASVPATIEIRSEILSKASAQADPTQIHQIIMNLCTNAMHAMRDKGGYLDIRLVDLTIEDNGKHKGYPDAKPGDYILLSVSDQGKGIEEHHIHRIFDPFYTTKEKGEGTGMGLSVVHGIVKSYGGLTYVHSKVGKGSRFDILLPALEILVADETLAQEEVPRGNESILLVDDESMLVEITTATLKSLGYRVIARTSPLEGLEAFKQNPARFDLVLTDMTMPKMTGIDLAEKIVQIRPEIPIILCTGFSANISPDSVSRIGIRCIINKPLLRRDVALEIRKALDEP